MKRIDIHYVLASHIWASHAHRTVDKYLTLEECNIRAALMLDGIFKWDNEEEDGSAAKTRKDD